MKIQQLCKRVYDSTIALSESRYGAIALFFLAAAESAFLPLPANVLLMALCLGKPSASFRFATICTVGSVLGGILGYGIGLFAFEAVGKPLLNFYDPQRQVFTEVKNLYHDWGFWGVVIAAITPIPYKLFTLGSGILKFDFVQFLLASIVGRSLRIFTVCTLIFFFGDRIKTWLEGNLIESIAVIGTLAIALLLLLKLF
ncbi:YqaA family protein [Oxynema sp. CENA135]|uniref:YqaA family protein n=1 Tax=Oxynema sp. CENA135 TaxID=984206 RepID=UPI001F218033|nr:VTT domain-containing protein [Oxynema sp. CENA135]